MSKKNNKTKKKQYVEMVKQMAKENEEENKRKKERKEVKRAANKLMNEIEDIGLEEKSDRMEVDKKPTYHHKKKMIRKKHGRYS